MKHVSIDCSRLENCGQRKKQKRQSRGLTLRDCVPCIAARACFEAPPSHLRKHGTLHTSTMPYCHSGLGGDCPSPLLTSPTHPVNNISKNGVRVDREADEDHEGEHEEVDEGERSSCQGARHHSEVRLEIHELKGADEHQEQATRRLGGGGGFSQKRCEEGMNQHMRFILGDMAATSGDEWAGTNKATFRPSHHQCQLLVPTPPPFTPTLPPSLLTVCLTPSPRH